MQVPLDTALGIEPYQHTSEELMRLGCLLSLVMPYELASWMLGQWSGLSVSASSLWNWVQQMGGKAQQTLAAQLASKAAGDAVPFEPMDTALAQLPLAIAADGVMVPFRPTPRSPKGKTRWKEVKVGILARLGTRLTRTNKAVPQLLRRRLVAVLGDIDQFIPHIGLEAQRQNFESAPQVVWLSDGGQGFWRVYRSTCFSHCAIAVLDFFHAAGHLAKATQALFDKSDSPAAKAWFRKWRHLLRHGHTLDVLQTLTFLIHSPLFTGPSFKALLQVQVYFQRHHRHMRYRWVNQRFDALFPNVPPRSSPYSPNR